MIRFVEVVYREALGSKDTRVSLLLEDMRTGETRTVEIDTVSALAITKASNELMASEPDTVLFNVEVDDPTADFEDHFEEPQGVPLGEGALDALANFEVDLDAAHADVEYDDLQQPGRLSKIEALRRRKARREEQAHAAKGSTRTLPKKRSDKRRRSRGRSDVQLGGPRDAARPSGAETEERGTEGAQSGGIPTVENL